MGQRTVRAGQHLRPVSEVAAPEGDPVWNATLTSAVKTDAQPHLRGHSPSMESAVRISPTTFTHNDVEYTVSALVEEFESQSATRARSLRFTIAPEIAAEERGILRVDGQNYVLNDAEHDGNDYVWPNVMPVAWPTGEAVDVELYIQGQHTELVTAWTAEMEVSTHRTGIHLVRGYDDTTDSDKLSPVEFSIGLDGFTVATIHFTQQGADVNGVYTPISETLIFDVGDANLPDSAVLNLGDQSYAIADARRTASEYLWTSPNAAGNYNNWEDGDTVAVSVQSEIAVITHPAVAQHRNPDEYETVWQSIMTVGSDEVGTDGHVLGFGHGDSGFGSLEPNTFTSDDEDHSVTGLTSQVAPLQLVIKTDTRLPNSLTLTVGSQTLRVSDSTYSADDNSHAWNQITDPGWEVGDLVGIQMDYQMVVMVEDTAPPAGDEVWTAEITVEHENDRGTRGLKGYSNTGLEESSITDDSFTYDGVTYRITRVVATWPLGGTEPGKLHLDIPELPERAVLRIDGRNYKVTDAEPYDTERGKYVWDNAAQFDWNTGDVVPMSMHLRSNEPMPAGEELWTATIGVKTIVRDDSSEDSGYALGPLLPGSTISNSTFTHDGTTYAIEGVVEKTSATDQTKTLHLFSDGLLPIDMTVLRVDGRNYALLDGTYDRRQQRIRLGQSQNVPVAGRRHRSGELASVAATGSNTAGSLVR